VLLDHVGDGGNGRRRASSLAAGRQVLVRRAGRVSRCANEFGLARAHGTGLFCEQVGVTRT
jgi:hypothetical protein